MRFVETYRARFGVGPLCQVMGMAPSTYYYRRARLGRPAARREQDRALSERITTIWVDSRFTYGSPRVHAQLAREGVRVGRKRVERLMRQAGLKGAYRSRYFRTTESDPSARVAPDLVNRDFRAGAPNQLWLADFTHIRLDGGVLFLACVLDAFSRTVVGWSVSDVRNLALVETALLMALQRRGTHHPGLIHHSDQGSQGGFNWSSQHLDLEVCGWDDGLVGLRQRRGGRRCDLRVGRRWRGGSIVSGSGRRLLVASQARTPALRLACRQRSGPGGSASVAACHRQTSSHTRAASCLSPSGRRSRSAAPPGTASGRSPGIWGVRRRRFPGSCGVMSAPEAAR